MHAPKRSCNAACDQENGNRDSAANEASVFVQNLLNDLHSLLEITSVVIVFCIITVLGIRLKLSSPPFLQSRPQFCF
jgi:hypothetical protein